MLEWVQDGLGWRRVFGEPIERDGVTVIPVARSIGGGGGGERGGEKGAGFGGVVSPVGVFVLKDGEVRWHPAVDPNLAVLVAAVLATMITWAFRRRS